MIRITARVHRPLRPVGIEPTDLGWRIGGGGGGGGDIVRWRVKVSVELANHSVANKLEIFYVISIDSNL